MAHILVADKIAEVGLERLRSTKGVTFNIRHGLSPDELAEAIGEYDGMLIRSNVQVTPKILENPGRLMAIAHAGARVDHIDLEAATEHGVLVLNTPNADTVSTAEHTFAMMLALYRRIPDAHRHVLEGRWDRDQYRGRQLADQTLGIIGLGRTGRVVATRALAFAMKVIAYDPFIAGDSALDGAVRMVKDLDELLRTADCVTLHAAVTDETRHMIGADKLAKMKSGARLINCDRGAIVDENALANALINGELGGAAVDVYENEPPTGSPLLKAKNIVLAPHLAASTSEAEERASIDAVDTLLAYLLLGEVRSAVNASGMPSSLSPRARAIVDLCTRMGTILSARVGEGVERIRVTVQGETLQDMASMLSWPTMVAVLSPHLDERINLVNAKEHAKTRGIVVEHAIQPTKTGYPETVRVTADSRGTRHEIEGTVLADGRPRVLAIDDYHMDLVPDGPLVLITNKDKPGVVGLIGTKFGEAGINIADMALSRREGTALTVLKLDHPMPEELRDSLRSETDLILAIQPVSLPPLEDRP